MRATIMHAARDVRIEKVPDPTHYRDMNDRKALKVMVRP